MPKGRFRIWDASDSEWRYTGAHQGPEWVRLTLPSGTSTSSTLNLTIAPIKQTAAPTELTVHSGSGRNIRIALNWEPDEEQTGWSIVPYVGTTKYPGRLIMPLGMFGSFNRAAVNFNNVANPGTFRGCMVQWSLDETNEEARFDVLRYNSSIGLPASATLRIYPWYGG